MRIFYLLSLAAALGVPGALHGQVSQSSGNSESAVDTSNIATAVVMSLHVPTLESKTSGSFNRIRTHELQNGVSPDLQDQLNALPGVLMETRGAGGSRRLQIRSSGLRSPFGVRNVELVMDGFILTNASGNAPLELFNPQWMHQLDVLRGPVGALYGNAYGGALIGQSLPLLDNQRSEIKGFTRFSEVLETGVSQTFKRENSAWTVRGFWSENSGYRSQEANAKQQIEMHRQSRPAVGALRHFWSGWMQAHWELPGSLNQSDANRTPTAAPGAAYDAHVNRSRAWIGLSEQRTRDASRSGLWLYAQTSDKTNPYGTSPFYNGDKAESELFASARWWRAKSIAWEGGRKLTLDHAAIVRAERLHLTETELFVISDVPRYSINNVSWSGLLTTGGRLEWGSGWQLDGQLGAEWFERIAEGERKVALGEVGPYQEHYQKLTLSPYAQLSRKVSNSLQGFVQMGTGASHPTSFELVDPVSYSPSALTPEVGHSWEIGGRWSHQTASTAWSFTLQGYHQRVRNAIALVPGPTDGLFLSNVDGLTMRGLEFSGVLHHRWTSGAQLNWRVWSTANRHAFEPMADILPGTPLHAAGSLGLMEHRGWGFGWQHHWFDRTKLHDYKDDWAAAHHRITAYFQYRSTTQRWQVGVRNVLNTTYSGWNQVNAFGGRYFNPAPPRTVWISWSWNLKM